MKQIPITMCFIGSMWLFIRGVQEWFTYYAISPDDALVMLSLFLICVGGSWWLILAIRQEDNGNPSCHQAQELEDLQREQVEVDKQTADLKVVMDALDTEDENLKALCEAYFLKYPN